MAVRKMRALKALSLLMMFCFAQVYVQAGLGTAPPIPQGARLISARLSTRNNQPITVNGGSASSGATILTGATIETPDAVSATVDLGPLGSVDLGPNSKIQLDFDDNGMRVKVLRGCVAIKAKKGEGEAYTAEGASEKTNSNRKAMGFCYLNGQLNPGTIAGAAAAGGGGGGIGTAALVAIIAGGGATAAILAVTSSDGTGSGANPSP